MVIQGQKGSLGLDSKKFNAWIEGLDLILWATVDWKGYLEIDYRIRERRQGKHLEFYSSPGGGDDGDANYTMKIDLKKLTG